MKSPVSTMKKRYNSWKDKPLSVPLITSARAVVLGLSKATRGSASGCSCRASCGGECKTQSCTSCKVD
jgi:hypothetical protein